jgi:uncharacterized membrane protein YebE (DUF533 family)
MKIVESKVTIEENGKMKNEATVCMALGAGVGTLGAASALVTGAVCPLCIFIAPGLVGFGAYRRWQAARMMRRMPAQSQSMQSADPVKDVSAD